MSTFVEYNLQEPIPGYLVMSVDTQPLIVAKKIEFCTYQVTCIYPRPEFYAREIRLFLRCEFPKLNFLAIEHMAKDNVSYITKRLI